MDYIYIVVQKIYYSYGILSSGTIAGTSKRCSSVSILVRFFEHVTVILGDLSSLDLVEMPRRAKTQSCRVHPVDRTRELPNVQFPTKFVHVVVSIHSFAMLDMLINQLLLHTPSVAILICT